MTAAARLLSLQVGMPRTLGVVGATDPMEKRWTSAIFKEPALGPVRVAALGLAGDGQADRQHHGGPDKAINVYPSEHYAHWREELSTCDMAAGAFGENFTTVGLLESEVCIGDTFAVGEVLVQLSQPRQPCFKLARRWRVRDFVSRIRNNGRSGWYFRVLRTGEVAAGMPLVLADRPYPEWTVARANELMYRGKSDRRANALLAACPALSASWRETLSNRAIT